MHRQTKRIIRGVVHYARVYMRYLLFPLIVLVTTDTSLAQVYEVVPRDLGVGLLPIGEDAIEVGGFAIEGGTIKVVDGIISEWNIHVTGAFPHTFTHEDTGEFYCFPGTGPDDHECGVSITPDQITFEYTRSNSLFRFRSDATEEIDCWLRCTALLEWSSTHNALKYRITDFLQMADQSWPRLYTRDALDIADGPFLIATVVPEPSGLCLTLVGTGLFGAWRKRNARQRGGHSNTNDLAKSRSVRCLV